MVLVTSHLYSQPITKSLLLGVPRERKDVQKSRQWPRETRFNWKVRTKISLSEPFIYVTKRVPVYSLYEWEVLQILGPKDLSCKERTLCWTTYTSTVDRDTLNLESLDHSYDCETEADNGIYYFRKQRLDPKNTEDGRKGFDTAQLNNRMFILF